MTFLILRQARESKVRVFLCPIAVNVIIYPLRTLPQYLPIKQNHVFIRTGLLVTVVSNHHYYSVVILLFLLSHTLYYFVIIPSLFQLCCTEIAPWLWNPFKNSNTHVRINVITVFSGPWILKDYWIGGWLLSVVLWRYIGAILESKSSNWSFISYEFSLTVLRIPWNFLCNLYEQTKVCCVLWFNLSTKCQSPPTMQMIYRYFNVFYWWSFYMLCHIDL